MYKYKFANASEKFDGKIENGLREGSGKMIYANKSEFNGTWKKDVRQGPGILKLADGTLFEGEIKAVNAN